MNNTPDFVIRDGILLEYRGPGGTVAVPEGVIGIRAGVFRKSPVEEVLLPDGLQWMGEGVFAECAGLRRLVLPRTLQTVPPILCYLCGSLNEVVIPEGVRVLSACAFYCSGLKTVRLPDSVWAIREGCFASCRDLEEIILGEGLQILAAAAFQDCGSLRAISFPDSLTCVRKDAFSGCARLASLHTGQGLESVEDCAFRGCRNLREAEFPDPLSSLWESAFEDCAALERITLTGQQTRFQHSSLGPGRPLARTVRAPRLLPEEIPLESRSAALAGFREMRSEGMDLHPGISEAWEAFSRKEPDAPEKPEEPFTIVDGVLVSTTCRSGRVVVPEGVIGIRARAFQSFNVEEVWLPDTVQWLQPNAFHLCLRLQAIRLPAGLTVIPEYVFSCCCSLRTIHIPDTVKRIGSHAFYRTGLETLTLPASLERMDYGAFYGCKQLREVRFPEGLRTIEASAFADCSALSAADLPDTLELLGVDAFSGCAALERVRLGRKITRLESKTFCGCSSLKELSASAPSLTIQKDCFANIPHPFRITLKGSFLEAGRPDVPLEIVARNANPAILNPACLRSLLQGFASEDGKGFRFEEQYLELLRTRMREFCTSEGILHFLLRHDMMEREDVGGCLDALQESGMSALVAEVLEYCHRRFPDQPPLPLELP